MRKSSIRTSAFKKCSEILPTYEVIGFYEKAVPIYIVNLKCEITSADRMPIIHDTLLRLLHQGMDINIVVNFLGLQETPEIVESARLDLASIDLIKKNTNELTEKGRWYLSENGLEQNKQIYFTIEIDGMTGKYEKNGKFVSSKNLAGQNISELYMTIPQPDIHNINKEEIRNLFLKNRDKEMRDKNQKVSDILAISSIKVEYRRVNCIVLKKEKDDFKVLVFDRNTHVADYDGLLEDGIRGENTLANISINPYFVDNELKLADDLELTFSQMIDSEFGRDYYDNLIFDAKRSITMFMPILSYMIIKDDMIDILVEKAKRGVKVKIFLTGSIEDSDSFQQRQISRLASIKIENFSVQHIPYYMESIIFIDDYSGLLTEYNRVSLSDENEIYSICERYSKISSTDFVTISNKTGKCFSNSEYDVYKYTDKTSLRNNLIEIIDSLYPLETQLRKKYGHFIRRTDSEEFSEVENVLNSNLAKSEADFKNFSSNLNKMLYEPIPNKNNIFFSKLKIDKPDLYTAIDKIRVYRNSIEHRKLDPRQKPVYEQYLKEDLGGRAPLLVEGGFLILQGKIIQELHSAICK